MYYGLSFNTNDLAGNPYLNFFLAGVLEFPSYVILFWGIKKRGRRPTLIALMMVGGIACAAIAFVPTNLEIRLVPKVSEMSRTMHTLWAIKQENLFINERKRLEETRIR
ncbi:organic cation transporter protein [Caerostris extrusa]|uniref:Organic cation transporter protein n=1 Tax=Caerostris extrusa TaxID=172846 RepID=A0AAV4SMV6_CAEEX|nr:organic cation transporter protein [Caerostris extrusa]